MLPCGGIGPFAGGAGTVIRPRKADIEAAAGRIVDIADQPVATVAAAIREVISTHGLGTTREGLRQIGGLTGHESLRSCRAAIGKADRRMPLHQPGENAGAGLADGNEQPQFPADDLGDETHRLQAVDHAVGESPQFDAGRAHDHGAAQLQSALEVEDGAGVLQCGPRIARLITGVSPAAVCATQAGDTSRPITRSPESVWSR